MADVLDFNDAGTQGNKPITVALAYAAKGWPVFPCNPLTKAPLTKNGFKDATTDALKVRAWWGQHPNAMIGVPTGAASGFWVQDVDTDKAKGKDGIASLAAHGHDLAELMDTVVGVTASGGYHCLFRFDAARPVGIGQNKPWRDLDIRGEGGYIIAAGSTRADGRRYTWLNPPDENEISEAPEWLLEAVLGATSETGFDFNAAPRAPLTPERRVQAIEPGTWHENTRDLVARMVREGSSDETIAAIAPRFTLAGYTDEQTVREFLTHARTAREKWGYQPKDLTEATPAAERRLKALDVDELENLEPITWLVDGHIPESAFIGLYGPSGGLKSFVALDIAMSVATGREWHGHQVQQGLAVYVAGEGQRGLAKRVIGWRRSKGAGLPKPAFKLVPHSVALPTMEGVELLALLQELPDRPKLIVLDTLARMFGSGDENTQKDMNAFIASVDRLQAATGAAVLVVHHTGKDETKGERGSSNLRGALDTSIFVRRRGRAIELVNQAPHGKQKDADEFEDVRLYAATTKFEHQGAEESTLVLMTDENPLAEDVTEPKPVQPLGPLQEKLLALIAQAARDGRGLGFTSLAAASGADRGNLGKALRKMVVAGLIEEEGEEGSRKWKLP